MRNRLIIAAIAFLAAGGSLAAQERSTFEPPGDSVVVDSRRMPLPAELVPPATIRGEYAAFDHDSEVVPLLYGIAGGIAGLFLGNWWLDQECGSNCGAGKIAVLFLTGGLGSIIGWVIGGGEIPQPPPGRWP